MRLRVCDACVEFVTLSSSWWSPLLLICRTWLFHSGSDCSVWWKWTCCTLQGRKWTNLNVFTTLAFVPFYPHVSMYIVLHYELQSHVFPFSVTFSRFCLQAKRTFICSISLLERSFPLKSTLKWVYRWCYRARESLTWSHYVRRAALLSLQTAK